jgi:hypothetical protein
VIDGKEFREQRNRLKAELGIFGRLAENEEGDGPEYNRSSGDTRSLCFFELLDSFVEVQLELGLIRELGNDIMVV